MLQFKKLQEHHLKKVLEWRTSEHVAKYMLSEVDNDLEKHTAWFKSKAQEGYWVIHVDDIPIGLINTLKLGDENQISWGYYIGDKSYTALGGIIPPYLYNHIFRNTHIQRIWAEVKAGNPIIKTHLLHGYIDRSEGEIKELFLDRWAWLANSRWANLTASFE